MRTGIIYDEPFGEYLASDSVGCGRLDDLRPRPLVYFKRWIEKSIPLRESTEAFDFGRFFHSLALEGEATTWNRYVVVPEDAPKRPQKRHAEAKKPSADTVAAVAWWRAFDKDNAGHEQIAREDVELAWRMIGAIRAKPAAVKILERGRPEVTFRHQFPLFSLQARVDWFDADDPAGPLLLNLKTIDSLDDFDYQFDKFGYYRSDAFYRMLVSKVMGIEASMPQCLNLVVEKNAPFECSIRTPDVQSLSIGAREVMADLTLLARCYESGNWPGESPDARPVSLPEWKVRRAESGVWNP